MPSWIILYHFADSLTLNIGGTLQGLLKNKLASEKTKKVLSTEIELAIYEFASNVK